MSLIKKPLEYAEKAWKHLNGIICAYKPDGASMDYVLRRIENKLCSDLNELKTRPTRKYIEWTSSENKIAISSRDSYADNVLCVGPRYQNEDILLTVPKPLPILSSGVVIIGVNGGEDICNFLEKTYFTSCYHLKGILGIATTSCFITEKVKSKSKYDHVERYHMERVLASFQSAATRQAFLNYGLDLKSEEAYEFATKGLFRPKEEGAPLTYNIKVVDFNPPHFTLEVQCINETQDFLLVLIHNMGISLKCYATCTGIRCIRQGCFTVEHALLKKYWTLPKILENMNVCKETFDKFYPDDYSVDSPEESFCNERKQTDSVSSEQEQEKCEELLQK